MEPDASDLTLAQEDRQELVRWSVACAERLLPLFAAERPQDHRLSEALRGALAFADSTLTVAAARELAFGCHAAAREASSPRATAAARTCGQAVAVAHMAGHSRQVGPYTAKALSGPARDIELDWQRTHLPPRFLTYVYGQND